MTFGLINWQKLQYPDLNYEVPLWYPPKDHPDRREWLMTNGLGGYSMGSLSGAHTRRYHGVLVSALDGAHDRHIILSRIDEIVKINGVEHQLATNHWASGVVSPTGYKKIESFTRLPCPTWVFELDGHYLIKQQILTWGTNEVQIGYHWLPDPDRADTKAEVLVRFLTGFRNFHAEVKGSSDDRYPQFVSPNHSVIILNESTRRLCLTWNTGEYESMKQWWWDFHWPEETTRGLPDKEDLYLVGQVKAKLSDGENLSLGASLDRPISRPDIQQAVTNRLLRQKDLLRIANIPKSSTSTVLAIACDQFLLSKTPENTSDLTIVEGFPWFNESGRSAMISIPGLLLSMRRFPEAKRVLETYAARLKNGLMPNRLIENLDDEAHTEYGAVDVSLWWGWALYQYFNVTKDKELIREQLPKMIEVVQSYCKGTTNGIKVDTEDGLLRAASAHQESTWMDAKVANIPITPRAGKAVEICALWYNFLETISFLAAQVEWASDELANVELLASKSRHSMQKFWNTNKQCLFDVIEPGFSRSNMPDQSLRPNQVIAAALPFRTLTAQQERSVLTALEAELLTPFGLRTLAPTDAAYQGTFGCGLPHADQYHRDLSHFQGMVAPWLLGHYLDAYLNAHGPGPETNAKIAALIQPLLTHLLEEAGLGGVSELFDGDKPHTARGCLSEAWSVAELARWYVWCSKHR